MPFSAGATAASFLSAAAADCERDAEAAAEQCLLQQFTAVPLAALEALRRTALEYKARAEAQAVMFLPRAVQRLLELSATADCAVKRARMQMHLLHATRGALYAHGTEPLALRLPLSEGISMPNPSEAPSPSSSGSSPVLPTDAAQHVSGQLLSAEARVLLATGARCDAAVPQFTASAAVLALPYDPHGVSGVGTGTDPAALQAQAAHATRMISVAACGQPPLLLVKPQLIVTMSELEALSHLRDLLVCLVTGRRLPDAWMLRALLLALRPDPNDVSGVTPDLVWRAHHWSQAFTPQEDEAVVALLGSIAARNNLGATLDVQPSRYEMTEADASSFPLLERFRQRRAGVAGTGPGVDDVAALGLRVRMAIVLVLNTMLKRCVGCVDMGYDDAASAVPSLLPSSAWSSGVPAGGGTGAVSEEGVTGGPTGSPIHALHVMSVGAMLRRVPHLVLVDSKEQLIVRAIEASETPGASGVKLLLDNRTAMASNENRLVDPSASLCTFAQLVRHMLESKIGDRQLRCRLSERETLFEVQFVSLTGANEDGMDWGGMYRETLTRCMEDLFGDNPGIDLFVLSPNAAAARVIDGHGGGAGTSGAGVGASGPAIGVSAASAAAASLGLGPGAGLGPVLPVASTGDGSFLPNPRYCPANVSPGAAPAPNPLTAFGSQAARVSPGRPLAATMPAQGSCGASSGATGGLERRGDASAAAFVTSADVASTASAATSISPQLLALASTMFAWVGRLFGISVRTKGGDLEADLSAVVWKMVVGEPVALLDIASLDARLGHLLVRVRDWHFDARQYLVEKVAAAAQARRQAQAEGKEGGSFAETTSAATGRYHCTGASAAAAAQGGDPAAGLSAALLERLAEEAFAAEFGALRFLLPESALTGFSSLGQQWQLQQPQGWCCVGQHGGVPLVAGGAHRLVGAAQASRARWAAAVVQHCVAPYAHAAACIRHGLASVIPERAVSLCGWRDLVRLVCGDAAVDVENLYKNTKYDSAKYYHDAHPVVLNFWRVMRELSPEQKRNFVRFAWGRSRLPRGRWPVQANGQQVKFTIVPRRQHFSGIPLSHTCFFLIELPEYPTLEALRRNLILAITYGAGEAFLIA